MAKDQAVEDGAATWRVPRVVGPTPAALSDADDALRRSERHFRLLVENAYDIITVLDAAGTMRFISPSIERVLGYRPESATGQSVFSLIHPDDLPRAMTAFRQVIQQPGTAVSAQVRCRHIDNSWRVLEAVGVNLLDDPDVAGIVANLRDVTEREQASKELCTRAAQAGAVAALGVRALAGVELSSLLDDAVALVAQTLEVEYSTIWELLPDGNSLLARAGAGIRDGLVGHRTLHLTDSQVGYTLARGAAVIVEDVRRETRFTPSPLFAEHGAISGVSVIIHGRDHPFGVLGVHSSRRRAFSQDDVHFLQAVANVTATAIQRKQMEESLLRAQRLETAGRVAGQVAHDLNNLLAPLVGYADLIQLHLPADHPLAQHCRSMVDATRLIAEINEDLLTLGRRAHANQTPLDLNRLVRRTIGHVEEMPSSITTDLELAEDLQPIKGTEAQLLRVLTNLVVNARESIHGAGRLTIRTTNVRLDAPLWRYDRVERGAYVRVEVSDTGGGIAPDLLDHIFDAFFTTKSTDRRRGSGLGLAVVQAIVDDHRGYVDVQTEIGRGTTFGIYLPVCREAVESQSSPEATHGDERVLVVDDDRVQREVVGHMLRALGYSVTAVSSGEAAIDHVRHESVDLMIFDMVMPPGIDGCETYRRVTEVRPGQRAIILSGFAETERVEQAQALGAGAFIQKPLTIEKLARAVRTELERVR
ncbi:MAG TPA: ATP-binding protein [Chloroflexota bacterium]|nr:ATP-binding protein [Chloroflexota bacterium]